MLNRLRLVPVAGLAAAAASMFTAGTAHAALATPTAQNCGNPSLSQAFLPWGDTNQYFLAPGGNLADSGASWSLSGGAAAVSGGDGYSLGGNAPSTQSLALPDNSSATTAPVCVGVNDPTIRFFARNTGSSSSTLQVTVHASTTAGLNLSIPIADISAGGTWSPSATIETVANLLTLLPNNMTDVTFTFAPQGQGGNWQIDDLYVDPWQRGPGG